MLALAIAASVVLRGRRAVHLLFAAFATDVALWYASQSLYGLFQAEVWARGTVLLTVLLPQFAIHLFEAVVPTEVPAGASGPASRPAGIRRLLRSGGGSRLPRVALLLAVPMVAIAASPYHETTPAQTALYFYAVGLLAAALVLLWIRGRRSPSRAVRERVRLIVVVGALATVFTLGDFLSFLGTVVIAPIGAVLAIVFLFVLAESLTRSRMTDLYEMAGRLLVSTALAFSLAGIFYLFVTVVGRFNTMYLNAVLAAIIFLVLFEPLQNEVEKRIHQFFFRERYDLETSVADLRKRLSHVLERQGMIDTVLDGLERSRRVTSCAVYLRDQEGNGFDLVGHVGETPPRRIEALAARPLLDRLTQAHAFSLEELAREGREQDAPVLAAATATLGPLSGSVVCAIRADEGELVGLLCVADDRVRDAFTPEEIALLEGVGAQVGVAVANARIYARMKERDRLAALGEMAAGLAHEVKNPLGAIKGAAQLLEEGGMDAQSREFVGIILEEVDRLNEVVGSFLDYARPRAGNAVPLDVNAAVRRTLQILSSQHSDAVEVKLELAEHLPRAKIDPEQLRQVLINLVQNAIQAMDGRGKVTVATQERRLREKWTSTAGASDRGPASGGGEAARWIEIAVRDTGPGITQNILKNLFVPFFTTKEQGTGLGLAISQSIVQNAGGNIEVHTQAGAGTTFTVVLPAAEGTLVSTPLPEAVEPASPADPSEPASRSASGP
jgi:signal transduction histidine kinase